jgi:hypothetical protein
MDPHRLSCPAAADAADTEDWGKIRAQSSRSFDFFVYPCFFLKNDVWLVIIDVSMFRRNHPARDLISAALWA